MPRTYEELYDYFYKDLTRNIIRSGDYHTMVAAHVRAEVAHTLLTSWDKSPILDSDIRPHVQASKNIREIVYNAVVREGWINEKTYNDKRAFYN